MKHLFILLVKMYQKGISRFIPPRCSFYPTCSQYAVQALELHGTMKGLVLAAWRVLRCNPFNHGGLDYVPQTFRLSTKNNHEKPQSSIH